MASRAGTQPSKVNEKCNKCQNPVKDKDYGLQCEICDKWFHLKCGDMEDEAYKYLSKENLHWYCNSCNGGIGKILASLARLQMRQEKMEEIVAELETKFKEDMANVEIEMSKMKKELITLRQNMTGMNTKESAEFVQEVKSELGKMKEYIAKQEEQAENQQIDGKWAEVVKKQVDLNFQVVTSNLQHVKEELQDTRQKAVEERDKEARRNNIVLYRVPESDASKAEDRNRTDISFCLSFFNNALNSGVMEEDLQHVFRLGARGETPRPLLVQLSSHHLKNVIMESLYRLKQAEHKFKSVIVSHDLTKSEREECKKLVEEAKELTKQNSSGEFTFRVRGPPGKMKIVKIRSRKETSVKEIH